MYRRTRVHPQLNDYHKMQRLAWCLANVNNDFHNYVFIDETKIRVEELPLYHIREKGVPVAYSKITDRERLNLNFWGGISCCGPTEFVGFEMNINGHIYCDILLKHLSSFVFSEGNNGKMVIHQDNASTHTGQPAKSFLSEIGLIWVVFY